jgi:hypothetical protein
MVPFGLREGRLYAPADVPSGLACACFCPGCGATLVAKKGKEKRWHFSHLNVRPGESCAESAIHAAAKQVLLEHGALMAPEFAIDVAARTMGGRELFEREVLSPVRRIRFDRTVPEVSIGEVRPDIVGYRGERRLLVEMYFRHKVDEVKRGKLVRLGLPVLEIDLSDLDVGTGFESLTERVINSVVDKEWLVYPRSDVQLAFLERKLRTRIEAANDAHRRDVQRQKAERAKLAQLEEAEQMKKVGLDQSFSCWTPDEQEAWLRQQLGLANDIPAFLSRHSYPGTVLRVPFFHFQASIFERFIHGQVQGTRLTVEAIYRCVQRRFELSTGDGAAHRLAVTAYLEYLTHARFLFRASGDEARGPYYVDHGTVSMPPRCPWDTQYDGQPLLSAQARGSGPRRRWTHRWPRWRSVMDEAREVLAESPHREVLLGALDALSSMTPPASPHHWAAPLIDKGVELEYCFDMLSAIGLITD